VSAKPEVKVTFVFAKGPGCNASIKKQGAALEPFEGPETARGEPHQNVPAWVESFFESQEAREQAQESEERIARMAEQKAAQFNGK